MIVFAKRDAPTGDFPTMSRDEVEIEWRKAKECFDQVLVQKTKTDLVYVAAATQLNTIERLMKKMAQRKAIAEREAARSLRRSA